MMKKLGSEIQRWVEFFLSWCPGSIGVYSREIYWKRRFKSCGLRLRLGNGVQIFGAENISLGDDFIAADLVVLASEKGVLEIGDRVSVGKNSSLGASLAGEITIGNDNLIAHNCTLRASDHEFSRIDIPIRDQGHRGGCIRLGSGIWIAANAVITANVEIGDGSIVAAGAVVTRDIQNYQIVGGIPAKPIGNRLSVNEGMDSR